MATPIAIQNDSDGTNTTYAKAVYILNGDVSLTTANTGYNCIAGQGAKATSNIYTLPAQTTWIAQSINVGVSDTSVDGVVLRLCRTGDDTAAISGTVVVRIETDNAGKPSGTLVNANATCTENASDIHKAAAYGSGYAQAGLHAFKFAAQVTLSASTTYWIVCKPTGAGWVATSALSVGYSTSSTYASGSMSITTTSGSSWTNYSTYDMWFWLFVSGWGSTTPYSYSGTTGTVSQNYSLHPSGAGNLVVAAGETLTFTAPSSAGQGYGVNFNLYGGGGLTANGTSASHATMNAGSSSARVIVAIYGGVGMKVNLDYLDMVVYSTNGLLFGVSSSNERVLCRGGTWTQKYNGAAAYIIYYYSYNNTYGHRGVWEFYGITMALEGATGRYHVYGSNNQCKHLLFVDCDFNAATPYASGVIRHSAQSGTSLQDFNNVIIGIAGCRVDSVAMTQANVYCQTVSGVILLGYLVYPCVKDGKGVAVSDALVSVNTQFPYDSIKNGYKGIGRTPINAPHTHNTFWELMADVQPRMGAFCKTNSSGYPVDELGIKRLWMPYALYGNAVGLGTSLLDYCGGSSTSIRSTESTTWNNDGTDEGCIIQVSHATKGGITIVTNPSSAYTTDVTITSGGDTSNYNYSKVVSI
jgi:hypothetical protein